MTLIGSCRAYLEERRGANDIYCDKTLKKNAIAVAQLRAASSQLHLLGFGILFSTRRHHSKHSSRAGPGSRQPMLLALWLATGDK
jgi:hypothetical protein